MLLLGLGMDEVGVYCSWDMPGRPSIIPSTTFLGKGPSLPQGSWWCVLRVRSKGVGFVNRRLLRELVYRLEYLLLAQLALSVIPGLTPVVLSCPVTLQPSLIFSLPPLFHELFPTWSASCFPNPFTFRPLALPHSFFFCPFTPVTRPSLSFLAFPLMGNFPLFPLSFHPLMHCLFLGGLT